MTEHFKLKKGLDLPINGKPEQVIHDGASVGRVAIVGPDYIGMKPTMHVAEGDVVKLGQALFEDKKKPGVMFTSPGAGTVEAINRGKKRVLQSVVIKLDGDDAVDFGATDPARLGDLTADGVRETLINSGLWTSFRTRPYSRTPNVDAKPNAVFVTATDSNPLAADPAVVIADGGDAFANGLTVLARLVSDANSSVWVCQRKDADLGYSEDGQIKTATFEGPHPSGLAGTHMHLVDAVGVNKINWTIGYQDVMAIGRLFTTGKLPTERVVAFGGAALAQPRLVRTRLGASTNELLAGEALKDGDARPLSGSVWNGRRAAGWAAYLGRFHQQVTVLPEPGDRQLFGWVRPGGPKFSVLNVFFSALGRGKQSFDFSTSQNGSTRAMVPLGNYERVMPLDILPTQLLRAIVVRDTDSAQQLGALELDEEDVALCSFVCVGKYNYGKHLRASLTQIEVEG